MTTHIESDNESYVRYGHVIGRGHSRNPRSIMYPSLFEAAWYPRFRACRRSA